MSEERVIPSAVESARSRLRQRRRPLAEDVRDLIATDYLGSSAEANGRLPSEQKLAETYGVSRVTVRAALHSLREAGLISTKQGVGARILPRSATVIHGLDRLCSIDTFAREGGSEARDEGLAWNRCVADADMANKLHVPIGHPVFTVERVKMFGNKRVAWIVDHAPADVLPAGTIHAEFDGSLLDVFLAHDEVGVEFADAELIPVALEDAIASKLHVSPGLPALMMDTVIWARGGKAVCWGTVWMLPEHFHFRLRRRRPVV